jgi:hypothetical protein
MNEENEANEKHPVNNLLFGNQMHKITGDQRPFDRSNNQSKNDRGVRRQMQIRNSNSDYRKSSKGNKNKNISPDVFPNFFSGFRTHCMLL